MAEREEKIGGVGLDDIKRAQGICTIFSDWSGGESTFCQGQCVWKEVPIGQTAACPHADKEEETSAIPKQRVVSDEVIFLDKFDISIFDRKSLHIDQ